MISSPCKTCPKSEQPKDNCYQDCKLIQVIQNIERLDAMCSRTLGIDCSEESRYTVHLSSANNLTLFNL
jgi:hypothetical protein